MLNKFLISALIVTTILTTTTIWVKFFEPPPKTRLIVVQQESSEEVPSVEIPDVVREINKQNSKIRNMTCEDIVPIWLIVEVLIDDESWNILM